MTSREYVGEKSNRSDSDDGQYVLAVQDAVKSYESFSVFKRNPHYQAVLEHVSEELGHQYLAIIKRDSPALFENIEVFKKNDLIGNPTVFGYPDIGIMSPTTLRYIKVTSDLIKLFGSHIGERVVEIGGGYGGQALINDSVFRMKEYELLDLPPVLSLISRYLESHIMNCAYKVTTLNQKTGDDYYDLVISNYAFSELPSHVQIRYIEKIVRKSSRGYLTMNSGLTETSHPVKKLSLEQLRNYLPSFDVFEEHPLTGPENYIIAWGHSNKL